MDGTFGRPYPNPGNRRHPSGFPADPVGRSPLPTGPKSASARTARTAHPAHRRAGTEPRQEPGALMIVRTTSQVRPSPLSNEYVDVDPQETAEFLLDALMDRAQTAGIDGPSSIHTPYLNTVPKDQEVPYPGDRLIERK